MTVRDLLENHADVLYHGVAFLIGVVTAGMGIAALVRFVWTGHLDPSLLQNCAGFAATATAFMAGGTANARWNPNNS